ncbi:MAG: hypothetical protein QF609_11380 [Gammaproteobacteria bacterium]|nr:hypothetical protein [Gammaproteobacteria bacterium]
MPACIAFDFLNPASNDGKSGRNFAGGTTLSFAAPTTATRLYLGVIDAFGFAATTDYYNDQNSGINTN